MDPRAVPQPHQVPSQADVRARPAHRHHDCVGAALASKHRGQPTDHCGQGVSPASSRLDDRHSRRVDPHQSVCDQGRRPGARPERSIPTLETLAAIADALDDRYRALVYTAALAGLRAGELAGLERRHVDLVHRTVTVEQQAQVVVGRGRVLGPPKSDAGRRTVAIPTELAHISRSICPPTSVPNRTPSSSPETRAPPITTQHWSHKFREAADSAGAPGLHFHDLRHLAGTRAAATGASTRAHGPPRPLHAKGQPHLPARHRAARPPDRRRHRRHPRSRQGRQQRTSSGHRRPRHIADESRHAGPWTQKKRPPRRALYRP